MRRFITIPLSATLVMTMVAPTLAAGPLIFRDSIELEDELFSTCGDFDVMATDGVLHRIVQTWTDAVGNATLERRHVRFDIVLTNSVTGRSGSYTGRFNLITDSAKETLRFTGAYRQLHVDGRNVLSASGYTLIDLTADPELQFVRGHSSMDEWEAGVCASLT